MELQKNTDLETKSFSTNQNTATSERVPDYVTETPELKRIYDHHGFYPLLNEKNEPVAYMFKNDTGGHTQVADFYMIPLLHIYNQETELNKRVIQINRFYSNQPLFLEIKSKSFVSLQAFEEILLNEEAVNFENGEVKHFKKIRQAMSYDYTECKEIKVFGQQNEGFFAFSNAIFHEVKTENGTEFSIEYANELGLTTHKGKNYYSPAYSKMYANMHKDSNTFEQQQFFAYKDIPVEKQCSFEHWATLMNEAYKTNDNGKWAIIYAIMCAFRSDIHVIDKLFTSLFFAGPTMSGKTQIAISIRSLFIDPKAPSFNLSSGTDAAFFTLIESLRDVPQILEEYDNKDISKDKFQGLKAVIYDGEGRQKRTAAAGIDVDTSKVNRPVIILGHEPPVRDDNALMHRAVICEVSKPSKEYTSREKEVFQELKEFENRGLCNILLDVLKLRPLVQKHFKETERQVNKDLTTSLILCEDSGGDMIRIIKTFSLFLAICKLLTTHAPHLKLPFTYDDFLEIARTQIKWQLRLIQDIKENGIPFYFK